MTKEINDYNPTIGTSFVFEFPLLQDYNYFIQAVDLPEVSMSEISTPFRNLQGMLPNNKIEYPVLTLTYLLSEDWSNYKHIVNWFYRVRRGKEDIADVMSDAVLHVTNSNKNIKNKIVFESAFPVSISGITFSSTDDATEVITSTMSFAYQQFYFVDEKPEAYAR